MNSVIATIQERAQRLTPQKQEKVIHWIDALLAEELALQEAPRSLSAEVYGNGVVLPIEKYVLNRAEAASELAKTPPTFDWAGQPDDPPEPLGSVELQHLATVYRMQQELDLK